MVDNLKIQPYLWHILVNLADKSQWRRRLKKEKVDVVFISNFRDDAERQKYLICSQIGSEFIDGFRINMGEVNGENIEVVAKVFDEIGIKTPENRCFGETL